MNDLIRKYFQERKAISIGAFEKESGVPAQVLYNFVNLNAELKGKNLEKIMQTIEKYSPGILKKYQMESFRKNQ